MAGKHDFYVIADGDEFFVRPGAVIVDGGLGRKVTFLNLTDYPVTATFPAEVVAARKASAKQKGHGEADLQPAAKGVWEFSVDVTVAKGTVKKARGNSWPKIIVDP